MKNVILFAFFLKLMTINCMSQINLDTIVHRYLLKKGYENFYLIDSSVIRIKSNDKISSDSIIFFENITKSSHKNSEKIISLSESEKIVKYNLKKYSKAFSAREKRKFKILKKLKIIIRVDLIEKIADYEYVIYSRRFIIKNDSIWSIDLIKIDKKNQIVFYINLDSSSQ